MSVNSHQLELDLVKADDLIRLGRHTEVGALLKEVTVKKIPRPFCVKLARLFRRIRLAETGARILYPFIYREGYSFIASDSSIEEKVEYAACLIRLGAVAEAEGILRSVKGIASGEIQKAFARISEWDYSGAVPFLKSFLRYQNIDEYERQVAQVNLAAAYCALAKLDLAIVILDELRSQLQAPRHKLLLANIWELTAQCHHANGEWIKARQALSNAEWLIGGGESLDLFFVRKWNALTDLSENPTPEKIERVFKLREEALRLNHSESVRDLTYHLAAVTGQVAELEYLYAGTPYPFWWERIEKTVTKLGYDISEWLDNRYLRLMGKGGDQFITIDEESGCLQGRRPVFRGGQVLGRIFSALNRDFFKPSGTGELYSRVFVGEHFSPFSSSNRIYQAVRRLNSSFSSLQIPVSVQHNGGSYSLRVLDGHRIAILCSLRGRQKRGEEKILPAQLDMALDEFRSRWTQTFFSVRDFLEKTGSPKRTVQRQLMRGVELGALQREGRGPSTKYRFVSPPRPSSS